MNDGYLVARRAEFPENTGQTDALKYLFHNVLQYILQRMRTDNHHLRTWPHMLHCSYKERWSMDSAFPK